MTEMFRMNKAVIFVLTAILITPTIIGAANPGQNERDFSQELRFLSLVYKIDLNKYNMSIRDNEILLISLDNSSILQVSPMEIRNGKVFWFYVTILKGIPITKDENIFLFKDLSELGKVVSGLIRRYEEFLDHKEIFYEKAAMLSSMLHGMMNTPSGEIGMYTQFIDSSDMYVEVDVTKYSVGVSFGYIVNGARTPSVLTFGFTNPKRLPIKSPEVESFGMGDKNSIIHYVEVENPYPKDDAIAYARQIMYAYYKNLGVSENEVEDSIDHIYAEIEFLKINATTAIPVWHIVFYFKHSLKDTYAYSVTLDTRDGEMIGSEPLTSMGNSNNEYLPWLFIILIILIPLAFLILRKFSKK